MRKKTKIWLIAATACVLAGGIVFGGVMTMCKWDFSKLSTVRFQTTEHVLENAYTDISIATDTADIVLVPADDANGSVVCYEQDKVQHTVAVRDGTLVIEVEDNRKWYEYIGISFHTPKITVRIPQGAYGALTIRCSTGDVEIPREFTFESVDVTESTGNVIHNAAVANTLKVKTDTGDIRVQNVFAGTLDLSVSTGKIEVTDVVCTQDARVHVSTGKTYITNLQCQNLISDGNTGDMYLTNVIAAQKFSLQRSTGDVRLDGCDATEIFVKTSTGDVKGSLLSDKVFITHTDTGRVNVPASATGGKCEITTSTGDIDVTVI